MMNPLAQDLKFFESATQSLSDYVLSDFLYWPMDVEPASLGINASRATLGLLYLVAVHIRPKPLNEDQAERFEISLAQIEQVRRKWKIAWQKKAAEEFKARTRQWYNFLKECTKDAGQIRARYRTEVGNRVILQMLQPDLPLKENSLALALQNLDSIVMSLLEDGDFIWDEDLKTVFPDDQFWFLYRDLNKDTGRT